MQRWKSLNASVLNLTFSVRFQYDRRKDEELPGGTTAKAHRGGGGGITFQDAKDAAEKLVGGVRSGVLSKQKKVEGVVS